MADPVASIPSEILSPLFSYFDTRELAILSSVCKRWRTQIQTDVIINRILDLTNFNKPLSEDETIQLVKRLAALSSYPKNEIHLSLQPFWKTLERALKTEIGPTSREIMQSTFSKFASLLSTISSATNGKLSRLELLGSDGTSKNRRIFTMAESIAEGVILTLDERMEILDTVSLELPLPVSLESGESTKFKLLEGDRQNHSSKQWELPSLLALIKRVTQFTGGGLTSLNLRMRQFADLENNQEVFRELLTEVEKSKSTLVFLVVGMETFEQSHIALATVIKCNNLSRLHLSFEGHDFEQQIFFPTTASVSSLQELWIDIFGLSLNWTSPSLTKWIGTNLKYLRISQRGSIPMDSLKTLLNRNPLLEDLSLAAFRISPSPGSVSTDALSLPRLKKLSVHRQDHLNELFSGAFLPSLLNLQFFPRGEEEQVQIPNLSNVFLPILQLCQSSVTDLHLSDHYGLGNTELSCGINDVVELSQVEILRLHRGSVNLVKLFSNFTFGKLKWLELDRTSISVQDVARLLVGSHLTLVNVTIDGNKKKRKGKDVELLRGCSFPKLKSLQLRKGSSHILELISQASFGVLETLNVDYMECLEKGSEEMNLEQASFCSFLKIMESNFKSLKEASFNGTTKEKEECLSFLFPIPFPALESLCIYFKSEVSPTLLLPLTTYRCPYLETLIISIVPPEPKEFSLEQVCRAIASTAPNLPDLYVSRFENEVRVQAG